MALKTLVKVSKISNLSDARYAAGMGVEMLGFRVIPGDKDFIPAERFQDIRGWISGPKVIAELYGVSKPEEISTALQTYAPDYFELSYSEYMSFRNFLSLPCIVYFPKTTAPLPLENDGNIAFILVDEDAHCLDLVTTYPRLTKISSTEILAEKMNEGCYKGFALEGGEESRPGVTNYDQLGGILEALEVD